jgi:uncharacterized protein (DUF2147 family)
MQSKAKRKAKHSAAKHSRGKVTHMTAPALLQSVILALALLGGTAWAADPGSTPPNAPAPSVSGTSALQSPVGRWRTIDDKTLQPSSEVRIRLQPDGTLLGSVEKVLDPTVGPGAVCEACADERHNRPIVGLEVLRGMHAEDDHWGGGNILDPDDGKVYRCRLWLRKGGQQLEVRGFIGISAFGRSQFWQRIE